MNSVTDLGLGLVFGAQGLGQKLYSPSNAGETLRISKAYLQSNYQRMRNILNPTMTYDAYISIVEKHPELLADLVKVLPGGVEDIDKLLKKSGFDPHQTKLGSLSEDFVDGAQLLSLVKAQDVFTKSQEFQLDKALRIGFGKSWSEFFADPNAAKFMNSKEYKQVVGIASYETQRAIFSKSFKDKTVIGEIAGTIENMRNIPAVGLLVPFGRFYNNTIAWSLDVTGVSWISKIMNPQSQQRSAKDLFVRGALGWGFIHSLADQGDVWREWGMNWDERPDGMGITVPWGAKFGVTSRINISGGTGATTSKRYDFPTSHMQAAATLL